MATQAFPTKATGGKPVALDSESGLATSTNESNERETRKTVGQETQDILGMETQAMTQVWSQTHIIYYFPFYFFKF